MLQQETPEDFVIATGQTRKLEDFVAEAFQYFSLDWKKFTRTDERFLRPTEIMIGRGNAAKAEHKLGWKAKYHMGDVVRMMAETVASSRSGFWSTIYRLPLNRRLQRFLRTENSKTFVVLRPSVKTSFSLWQLALVERERQE
jgi:hypothetical protein